MTDAGSAPRLPESPSLDGLEPRWSQRWQEEGTYAFDRSRDRADVYAIDTPLPTERRVQNLYGVSCDPSLPYDENFTPPAKPDPKRPVPISRRNFVELCTRQTIEDERGYEDLWRRLGLSYDWSYQYSTIGETA